MSSVIGRRLSEFEPTTLVRVMDRIELSRLLAIVEENGCLAVNDSMANLLYAIVPSAPRIIALYVIDLSACDLPPEISAFTAAKSLTITKSDQITAIPDTIAELQQLTKLAFSTCRSLRYISPSIGRLSHLTSLTLVVEWPYRNNALTRLPDSIGDLTQLTELHISGFQNLTSLPPTLVYLRRLVSLKCLCSMKLRLYRWFTFMPLLSELSFNQSCCSLFGFSASVIPKQWHLQCSTRTVDQQVLAAILYQTYDKYKILLLVLHARRRKLRHPPPEIWELLFNEFNLVL